MKLFFDTETTGMADFKAEPHAAHQPRLVQLAALLTDDAGEEVTHFSVVIKPEGFEIPVAASAVAHNIDFDLFIMDGEFYRAAGGIKSWGKVNETFCTMKAMTQICKLPGKYSDFKWPKLQEAHKHAFGAEFDGTHDALADMRACARIYFWLQNQPKETQ